ncbi:MAG: dipeptidase [Firmicutes bacterium]|nr:dipeptidase [Bacillota bacterium]
MAVKRYDGYRSFAYLGEAERRLELADEEAISQRVTLTPEQRRRLEGIVDLGLVISLRDHGFVLPAHQGEILDYCRQPRTAYAYRGLALSGVDVLFDSFMDSLAFFSSGRQVTWHDLLTNLGMRYCDLAHQDTVVVARGLEDFWRAKRSRQVAVVPCLEMPDPIEGDLDRLDVLYGFGIRCMGLTYNHANAFGGGCADPVDQGLTALGRQAVRRLNRLGIAIDLAHCGEKTSLQAIEASEQPVLMSHVGARRLWDVPRLKSDAVLKACAEAGGVVGIMAAPFTTQVTGQPHTIEAVMAHFEYVANLVGIEHVALGPDTLFGDHVALQRVFDAHLGLSATHEVPKSGFSGVLGMENPREAMQNALAWLVSHGYSDQEIAGVAGANVIRALRRIWLEIQPSENRAIESSENPLL